jgi:hypothetical protein
LTAFKEQQQPDESFGDFCNRLGNARLQALSA